MKKLITEYVSYQDIDLVDKLDNMCCVEIAEEIFEKCMEKETFRKIEEKVWELMSDKNSKFSKAKFYEDLFDDEDEDDEDVWSARVYNCDLLYMVAIAYVLGLEIPKSCYDVEIFGM